MFLSRFFADITNFFETDKNHKSLKSFQYIACPNKILTFLKVNHHFWYFWEYSNPHGKLYNTLLFSAVWHRCNLCGYSTECIAFESYLRLNKPILQGTPLSDFFYVNVMLWNKLADWDSMCFIFGLVYYSVLYSFSAEPKLYIYYILNFSLIYSFIECLI